ncbi:hypothetical protein HZS_305 [Henneguya salminicola]|nr:hypothetical protein HZS_305 [Henneguya salminicola]
MCQNDFIKSIIYSYKIPLSHHGVDYENLYKQTLFYKLNIKNNLGLFYVFMTRATHLKKIINHYLFFMFDFIVTTLYARHVFRTIITEDPFVLFSYIFSGSKPMTKNKISRLPLLIKSLTYLPYHCATFLLNMLSNFLVAANIPPIKVNLEITFN